MREFYENEYLPHALSIGIQEKDFWSMNPRRLKVHIKAYKLKREEQLTYDNYIAYLSGIYVMDALSSTVGNMFKNKGSKPNQYPEKPYELGDKKEEELSQDEIQRQTELLFARLNVMGKNFEMQKKKEQEKQHE